MIVPGSLTYGPDELAVRSALHPSQSLGLSRAEAAKRSTPNSQCVASPILRVPAVNIYPRMDGNPLVRHAQGIAALYEEAHGAG